MSDWESKFFKAILFVLLGVALALTFFGCAHERVVTERVEVAAPYWSPPKKEEIKELPPRAPMIWTTITPEAASADSKIAFQAIGEDMRALIEENETIRAMYEALVEFVTTQYKPEEEPQ